jgi:methylthioribose-1-phosphate isomerase
MKKYLSFSFNPEKGETLIEAMGALSRIAIIVIAVGMSVTTSLNNAKFNQDQTEATKYAQEGMETVRQIRNTSYNTFAGYNGTYCLGNNQSNLGANQSSCSSPNVGTFIREVDIQQNPGCGANVARVSVTVSFADGKCSQGVYCHKQVHTSCFSTVNPVQAP